MFKIEGIYNNMILYTLILLLDGRKLIGFCLVVTLDSLMREIVYFSALVFITFKWYLKYIICSLKFWRSGRSPMRVLLQIYNKLHEIIQCR